MKFLSPLLLLALLAGAARGADRPPNIVVFLADDQGWGDLSFNGNTNLRTPNIDSIAEKGAALDRFFVCAVCAPTRAEFLTGRYHSRGGVRGVSTGQERLNVTEKTLADTLKAAGYATGAFGKWHNGSQWPYHLNARGFDEFYGFTSGHWAEYFDALLEHNGKPVRGRGYVADDFTDHALAFIEQHQARPFFCYVPYNTPHSPFCVPDEYWDRFKDKPIGQRGPEGERENLAITRCVLAMTENLDWNVGRVLRRLDELKLSENTIVVYFSDNGPAAFTWNAGLTAASNAAPRRPTVPISRTGHPRRTASPGTSMSIRRATTNSRSTIRVRPVTRERWSRLPSITPRQRPRLRRHGIRLSAISMIV